ncbi:hypothetical protein DPV78_010053 [Talaromyces pinophilus]|nr:hypothetical protein DPV78_010053 [Talaromyces pinophilus]
MGPLIFSCVVCGQDVYPYGGSKSWLGRCRILYSSPKGTFVSGVGLYNDPDGGQFTVPLEYIARWDDPGCRLKEVGVMAHDPVKKRHGFIFHEACWTIMEKVRHPQAIPYSRLYEVCKSMPFPLQGTGLSLGHDFGGLVLIDNENYYPWEDRVFERAPNSRQRQLANKNPLNVPEMEQLLRKQPQTIQTTRNLRCARQARQNTDTFGELYSNADTFGMLPIEIRNMITCSLSTSDIYNLRLASKTFSPFAVEGTVSTIYFAQRDACLSYRETAGDLTTTTSPGSYDDFQEGCRLLHRQYVSISQSLAQIAFSAVHVGYTEYISGIRLVSSEGAVTKFGYWSNKKVYSANITSLLGFYVAAGSRGIQALQVMADGQHTSQWLGSPDECPKTRYLAVSKPVKALKAGLINLGMQNEETKLLRDVGLWYPSIPGFNLSLNDYPSLMANYYRPLCWISFGGPGGKYLESLTGIIADSTGSIGNIQFNYDTGNIPAKDRRLGGEIINAVEVHVSYSSSENAYDFARHGALHSFKVSTNRGRHCIFGSSPRTSSDRTKKQAIPIAPGTTITGFYFGQHNQWGMTCLGVISEVIKNRAGEQSAL